MKKQVCLLTIISMLLCLTACAAQPESSKSNSSSQPVTESSTQISEESSNSSGEESRTQPETLTGPSTPHRDGYTLEQVVVLSRHNIRSPLSGGGSLLESITPHEWFHWSSQASELSMRGGILETEMGQYFRKWLESEEFFPENYHPEEGAVRIYANSKQRTIATAQFFTAGLLPTAGTDIETHMEFNKMDPVFTPQLTFVTPDYQSDAEAQIRELFTDTINGLSDNYELITDVIDMKESAAWKDGTVTELSTDDTEFILELNQEPGMKGSLKTGCSVSDALILQYYEEEDPVKAAFGHDLTDSQWEQIAEIKDVYQDVLFTAPLIAVNTAHPLLQEIENELNTDGRSFSFLCGHDSNISSVLTAMKTEDYTLPGTIEKKTPIGCKIVFCRWSAPDGNKYYSADLVYQTVSQLQNHPLLDLNVHPSVVSLQFSGIKSNQDGLYSEKEFMTRLRQSIEEYDQLQDQYSLPAAA